MIAANKIYTFIKEYFILSIATVFFCLAWEGFMIPAGITSGGLAGFCAIIQMATGGAIPVAYSYIVLQAVLIGIAFLILGNGFGFKTIYCILLSTVLFDYLGDIDFLKCIPGQPLYISEKIFVPVVAGLLEAVSVYFVFKIGASTGGTDIVALIINKFWPVSPGQVYLFCDLFIIASILLVPGKTLTDMLYGYITMITFSFAVDYLLLGAKSSVQVMVFSQKSNEIREMVINEFKRGATVLKAQGGYSKQDTEVILVIVKKNMITELTSGIKNADPKAFVTVCPVSGVYGEGFDAIKTGISLRKKRKIGALNQ